MAGSAVGAVRVSATCPVRHGSSCYETVPALAFGDGPEMLREGIARIFEVGFRVDIIGDTSNEHSLGSLISYMDK